MSKNNNVNPGQYKVAGAARRRENNLRAGQSEGIGSTHRSGAAQRLPKAAAAASRSEARNASLVASNPVRQRASSRFSSATAFSIWQNRIDCATRWRTRLQETASDPIPSRSASAVLRSRFPHGRHTPGEGLGRAHRAHAPERADAALHRPAPDPRGHHPAGLRHAARAGCGVAIPERTFATVDHIVPTPTAPAVPRRAGRGDDVGARAELPRVRHPLLGHRQRRSRASST